jgi:hypothetical protein
MTTTRVEKELGTRSKLMFAKDALRIMATPLRHWKVG